MNQKINRLVEMKKKSTQMKKSCSLLKKKQHKCSNKYCPGR